MANSPGLSASPKFQEVSAAHMKFGEDHPEWMAVGLQVVNAWGRGEGILQHLIAQALMESYDAGIRGEDPPKVPEDPIVPTLIRRTRLAPAEVAEVVTEPAEISATIRAAINVAKFYGIKTASELRLKLRIKGYLYEDIESAIVHWANQEKAR